MSVIHRNCTISRDAIASTNCFHMLLNFWTLQSLYKTIFIFQVLRDLEFSPPASPTPLSASPLPLLGTPRSPINPRSPFLRSLSSPAVTLFLQSYLSPAPRQTMMYPQDEGPEDEEEASLPPTPKKPPETPVKPYNQRPVTASSSCGPPTADHTR